MTSTQPHAHGEARAETQSTGDGFPQLLTNRLLLRPFDATDGPMVERLAGAREVADTTLTLPHPYPEGGGTSWITTHADQWRQRDRLTLAICPKDAPRELLGAIGLHFSIPHSHGEIG